MESQQKLVEPTPMLIPVTQIWDRLTLEHRQRLLQVLVIVCAELLSPPRATTTQEARYE